MAKTIKNPLIPQHKILDTARSLFQTKGFEQTTIKDIAGELDVSEDTVFAHFNSVDSILEAVWSER